MLQLNVFYFLMHNYASNSPIIFCKQNNVIDMKASLLSQMIWLLKISDLGVITAPWSLAIGSQLNFQYIWLKVLFELQCTTDN